MKMISFENRQLTFTWLIRITDETVTSELAVSCADLTNTVKSNLPHTLPRPKPNEGCVNYKATMDSNNEITYYIYPQAI